MDSGDMSLFLFLDLSAAFDTAFYPASSHSKLVHWSPCHFFLWGFISLYLLLSWSPTEISHHHSLIFFMVYLKVPYLTHFLSLVFIQPLTHLTQSSLRTQPSVSCMLTTPRYTSQSLLQIWLPHLKYFPTHSWTYSPWWTRTAPQSIQNLIFICSYDFHFKSLCQFLLLAISVLFIYLFILFYFILFDLSQA